MADQFSQFATSMQDNLVRPGQTGVFAPVRSGADTSILDLQNQISSLRAKNTMQLAQTGNTAVTSGAPAPAICTDLSAVESPYKTADGSLKSLVSVSFVNTDPNFAAADIYLTGYHGSTSAQWVTSGAESPISFLAETTKEIITVTVVASSADGAYQPIDTAPTTTVTLDGVVSAPPAPSIASGLVLSPLGYSFSFYVEGGLLQDVIDGYRIYRNASNTFTGATQIQYLAQPSDSTGTIQVQDSLPLTASIIYFYWVTSVNTSGLESAPTAVTASTTHGFPQQVTAVSAVESPYKTQSGQMLSLVAVDFTPAPGDPYFDSVEVWFTGYNGTTDPQLIAQGSSSPLQFLCETTHEVVTVTVVAVSASGVAADFAAAPSTYVALDGVMSAPPAPSISQAQVALAGDAGWQFSFNILSGLEFDLIQGYRVYHSFDSTTPIPPNNQYQYFAQPTTNVGTLVVQEVSGDILYFWVSAVNIAGMESILTPVPFTYTDPGDPAPPIPSPVTTTNISFPTTSLNGWAAHAHVGYWEAQDSDGGGTFGLGKYLVSPLTNPSAVLDGNQSTATTFYDIHHASYGGCVWSFSSFVPKSSVTITGVTLTILSEVRPTAALSGEASIYYSLNNGTSWTPVYEWNAHNTGLGVRPRQTDTITLSTSVDPTKIQVMACAHSHDNIELDVFAISLNVTQSGLAGPGKVIGVTASLVGGNVQVSWNGLTPLTRTDITAYEVYRAVHGAGYIQSHLHATITPTGSATYNWTDSSAHDGSYDYWVVAFNATDYSPASDLVTMLSASGALYANRTSLEAMRPAQAGADVTSSNTALDTTRVGGTASATVLSNISAATAAASAAQASANTANTSLASITSDNILSQVEKPAVILDWTTIANEQAGIDSQASASGINYTAYDAAIAELARYLTTAKSGTDGVGSGTSDWSNTATNSAIDGPTFRGKFGAVYAQRQAVLNAIAQQAQNTATSARNSTGTIFIRSNNLTPLNYLGAGSVDANASMGYATIFDAGWAAQATCNGSVGFSPISYDVYVRVRSNGMGNDPTQLPAGVYNRDTGAYPISQLALNISTAYQEVYMGRLVLNNANINQDVRFFFSVAGITTYYYLDYIKCVPSLVLDTNVTGTLPYSNQHISVLNGIDPVGNLKLKNTKKQSGVTANPSLAASYGDLPELGSGNGAMTFALAGNPILLGASLSFSSVQGSTGQVTGIGWTPTSFAVNNGSGPPAIAITISGGGGSGAGASVGWSQAGSNPNFFWTATLYIGPGTGYTSNPSVSITITNANGPYSNGTTGYTGSIGSGGSTVNAGSAVQLRVLMDGVTIYGPFQIATDANGVVAFAGTQLLLPSPSAGSHSFQVQAMTTSGKTIASTSRAFQLVELG